jgi:hypothetical protein
MRWHGRGLVVGIALLLVGCTSGGPDTVAPSPTASTEAAAASEGAGSSPDGARVVVVLGPTSATPVAEVAALRDAATGLTALPGVARVRVVEAATEAFAGDLLRLFADDGSDLVCLLGTGTASVLLAVARERPATRFCGSDPLAGPPPANLAVVALDRADVARAAGAALGPVNRPVVLLITATSGPVEPLTTALDEGVPARPAPAEPTPSATAAPAAGPGGAPEADATRAPDAPAADAPAATETPIPGSPSPGPTAPDAPAPDRRIVAVLTPSVDELAQPVLTELVADRPAALVALTARVDPLAAAVGLAAGVPVVGIADWLRTSRAGALPRGVLVAFDVDRAMLLEAAVADALATGGGILRLLGAEAGVLSALGGPAPGAEAALARADDALRVAAAAAR